MDEMTLMDKKEYHKRQAIAAVFPEPQMAQGASPDADQPLSINHLTLS